MSDQSNYPYRQIVLKPVPDPTPDQIRFFHGVCGDDVVKNFLGSRSMLIEGGYAPFKGLHHCDRIAPMLAQLDTLGLSYEVVPVDRHGKVPRSMAPGPPREQANHTGPLWSDDKLEVYRVELANVRRPDDFYQSLRAAFPAENEPHAIWSAMSKTVYGQSCPMRIELYGWTAFASALPKYARRLRRYLEDYRHRHPHALQLFFEG